MENTATLFRTDTEIRLQAMLAEKDVLLEEQQRTIDTLQEQLRLALRRQFGPRHEYVDVDQLGLLEGVVDDTVVVPVASISEENATASGDDNKRDKEKSEADGRRQGIRRLKELPRDVRIIDLPAEQKTCGCCGQPLELIGDERSEQIQYQSASLRILETRRNKYACRHHTCRGEIKRAPVENLPPIPKAMASASLLAYLIVSKFADSLPLYRIAMRLKRLGIELSDTLMSEWLLQCADLLEEVRNRILKKVLATGHIFTDDTILPMQNDDPERRSVIKARLWVYACHQRRQKPLAAYDFSRTRSQEAPMAVLKGYRGFIQADAFPGYDKIFLPGLPGRPPNAVEIACLVHARRKFVEAAAVMKTPGRAHEAIAFIKRLYKLERQARNNNLGDAERQALRQEKSVPILTEFKAWLDRMAAVVLPKSALGNAVFYALKNWEALFRYTEHGFLEADNNYAERLMKPVAIGRKNFMFVGNERAGHAAAIFYSLVESCKANQVNPLTYITYLLENVRNKDVTLLLPDEFTADTVALIG